VISAYRVTRRSNGRYERTRRTARGDDSVRRSLDAPACHCDPSPDMPNAHHPESAEVVDRPMSISHLVRTLHAYAPVILLSLAAVALAYIVFAIAVYVFSPTQRITTQKFRLDFKGASEGLYPNGVKFSSSDITSTPVLLQVFNENHLERFTKFPSFSRALFVLESNPDYERIAAEYQGRLADPKLSAVDRDRLQREWQAKSASLAKSDYSLNWLRSSETAGVPESVVRKVLTDTLQAWSRYATSEQRVLQYRVSIFSPEMLSGSADGEPIVAIHVLRSKIYKILGNVDDLREVPGSDLIRTSNGMSLEEIRLRLTEIVRFRLEPLAGRVGTSGLIGDRATAVRFLESQLAYDQRQLKSAQDGAEAIRQAMAVYSLDQRGFTSEAANAASTTTSREARQLQRTGETVMPQINDSFIDRLMMLTSQSNDLQYRQKAVDEYHRAVVLSIPNQQAVTYDQEVLTLVKNSTGGGPALQAADVHAEIVATEKEARQLLGKVNEVYSTLSNNLNPSKEIYSLTAPPVGRTEHSRNLVQLALYGVALLALALPVIIILSLLHARVREEEAGEPYASASEATAP
jgi:hypothetical protein